jgi:hypothetical protein
MSYAVVMERFWGVKEIVSMHANVQDAINALKLKKANMSSEVVFTIITLKGSN